MHKITTLQMIGYGDRRRTQAEVVRLFKKKHPELPPISQGTLTITSQLEGPFVLIDAASRQLGYGRYYLIKHFVCEILLFVESDCLNKGLCSSYEVLKMLYVISHYITMLPTRIIHYQKHVKFVKCIVTTVRNIRLLDNFIRNAAGITVLNKT
ncbi:hypothetical protein NQ318_015680 [Aromia moschata]|uniref:Uncharacterized protein n=1 Tax=Aromia moschata TaxID=1265417 RepID=A0AAV8YH49_9CUCU|nr:hypothetical protein NQ318_015680 [Aromia moschata]